ncbi:MAG: enoyl-CoA hydratase/isomerase family protein [Acidobacteria bacterium]|nr:enoyl-CoA hydratase/isomerase family protein [Acidobacteriota bacterium]
MEEPILWAREDAVGLITLNRPEAMNAMSVEMLDEMSRILDRAEGAAGLRVLILSAQGERAFCVGADLKSRAKDYQEGSTGDPLGARVRRVFRRLEQMGTPVIAAIRGYCLGGGLEMALACDLRVAAAGSQFGFPEAKVGSMPGAGGTQRATRLLGPARTKEMMFTCERIDAAQALAIGLVNRVVPAAALMDEARALAGVIGQRAPLSLAKIKAAVNLATEVDLDAGLEFEATSHHDLVISEDRKEGIKAFAEKREPTFVGR